MTSTIKLAYRDIAKRFGGVTVFEHVSFDVPAGTIAALIGPNGAGKSTLINITCGALRPDGGSVLKDGVPMTHHRASAALSQSAARTFQDVKLFPSLTVLENVLVAMPQQPGDNPWRLFGNGWSAAERTARAEAAALLDELEIGGDAQRASADIPFGTQKLVALARAVATGADTLLLDETTTGLELTRIPIVQRMLGRLRAVGRTILLVEHNMDVVAGIADQVIVLHGTVIAAGSPDRVLHDEAVVRDYLGRIYHA